MEISCVIIDDEQHAVTELAELIARTPGIFLVADFKDVTRAVQFFGAGEKVDVIFSDIDMPLVDGISAGKLLKGYCRELVYVTAHRGFALEAFGVDASGYLLKPVGLQALVEIVAKLSERLSYGLASSDDSIAFIKGDRKHSFLKLVFSEVIFIKAMLNYVQIFTLEGTKVTYMGLKAMEELLRYKNYFLRISKSVIVNMEFVKSVEGNGLYLADGTSLVVGETYREHFRDFLRKRTFNL